MIQFFLGRRVLTNLATLFVIGLGIYHFTTVKREAFPEISLDIVTVSTNYPGASPEEVERLVTLPIEETLRGLSHIDHIESYSIENNSLIILTLEEGLSGPEVTRAVSDIQQSVNRVQELPDETDAPLVTELAPEWPLITISVAGGDPFVRDEFADYLKDVFEDTPGISKVDRSGHRAREIWVEIDLPKLNQFRITAGEIADTLRTSNVNLSAGSISTGDREILVRTVGAFYTAEEVGNVILRGNDERNYLRVKDVARVREAFSDDKILTRADGQPAIHLLLRKDRSGDTIKLARRVKEILAAERPSAQEKGLKLIVSDDSSFFINRRLNVMKSNMMQGFVLIMIALFLFLDWRLALVAALGVPISFGAAMAIAVPFGFTFNLLSILGFIIVLGMLDDDSVVVAENIYRHLEMGKPPVQAAVEGTKEVVLPVLGSVAATTCAFLPFALVEGIMGKFLIMIPVIVITCFVASVLEAFFILPAHVLDILPLGKPVAEKGENHRYRIIQSRYRGALGWCIDHRYIFAAMAVGFLALTVLVASKRLPIVMFPEGMIDQFFIQVEMPRGSSLERTEKVVRSVEEAVLKLPSADLETITSTVGEVGFEQTLRRGTHFGQSRVFLTPQENRERSTDDILETLRASYKQIPDAKVTFEKLKPGPPTGKAVQARIRGDDPNVLKELAERMKEELRKMPGTLDIKDSFEGGKDELQIQLRAQEAAFADVNTSQIARHLLFAFEGGEATKIRRPTEEVVVKVKLLPEYRNRPDSLKRLLVLNERGQQVNLGQLVKSEVRQGPPYIQRYNFKRTIVVSAGVNEKVTNSFEVNRMIKNRFDEILKPYQGFDVIYGGEEEQTQKSMRSLGRGFLVAIVLDLIILATLFNSYLQPLIILLTIPIGLVGVAWALILHGQPASFMALLGVVAMTGVIVNNAIVLVDFINSERRSGKTAREAVIEAGATRLRPIFTSSVTTLLGLFPTAYGIGGFEPFVAPMCLALAWGLALAMPLTLFVIPMATLVADDFSRRMTRLRNKIFRKPTLQVLK